MTVRPAPQGLILFLAIMLCPCAAFGQTVIHVPQDQPTIQAGIDASVDGGTVLVAPGTYVENIDFKGKNIVVTSGATSSAGAAATVVQGAAVGPVVTLRSGEPVTATLNGFTITHTGAAGLAAGDGIAIANASATISNNVITGIGTCSLSAISTASTNIAPTNTIVISGNTISNSTIGGTGGSCGATQSPLANGGANVYLYQDLAVSMTNNLISNIQEAPSGNLTGNVSAQYVRTFTFDNNIVTGNYTDSEASLFVSLCPTVSIVQNLFTGNTLGNGGTATIDIDAGSSGSTVTRAIVNNTFSGNSFTAKLGLATDFDLGVLYGSGDVANNIFTSATYTAVACTINSAGTSYIFEHNDVYVPAVPQTYACGSTPAQTFGDISADPQFISPSTSNFQTQRTSPVVAAGDIAAPRIPAADLAGKNREVCGTIDMGAYEVHPQPPIALTSNPNPSIGSLPATFSVALTGNCNVPTGQVTFLDGATPIGTATLSANATASFTTSALTVGSHTITATYPGDFNFDPSTSNAVVQVVTGFPTSVSLQVSPNPAMALQPITFSAVASSPFGTPTGTVTFFSGATALGTASLNANGAGSLTLSTLHAGTYSVTAVCNPTVTFAQSTSPTVVEIVNAYPSTTSLTSSPNPSFFGQAVTFTATVAAPSSPVSPTGTVAFLQGSNALGTGTLSSNGVAGFTTSSLAVGSDTVTAVYGGSADDHASTSNAVIQAVGLANTALSLAGSPNPAYAGQTVTLTATLTSTYGGSAPAGSIVFADQFGTLGSAAIANGQATFIANSLSVGTHTISATFAGGGSFSPSVSPPVTEVIEPSSFAIALDPPSLTLPAGPPGTATLLATGSGTYAGTLTLSAGQLPMYMAISFKPASVTAGASASSVLTIATSDAPAGFAALDRLSGSVPRLLVAALILLPFLRTRRTRRVLTLGILPAALLLAVTACQTISYHVDLVAPGTYVIPITATDTAANVSHSVNLTVTITH